MRDKCDNIVKNELKFHVFSETPSVLSAYSTK